MKYYRADIDGLRAVAILPVILFHAGFDAFSGGYIGVDVFFVISGYLITSIIAREILQDRFSLLYFYERRIRRIFPALFSMMSVVFLACFIMFMPQEFEDFSKSIMAATFFASNVLFFNQSGYFDGPAEMKPLLHTWSLSVEEQFYIFFPPLLMLMAKLKKNFAPVVGVLAFVSFILSIWAVSAAPTAAFYLPHSRAWELLVGSMLALGGLPAVRSRALREILGISGLALIAWAVFTFNAETPFPGANALFPCLGAAFLIYSGTDAPPTFAARFLSLKPLVFIGLISYSLYLWHWPMLVLAEYLKIDELTHIQSSLVLLASIALSAMSWKFVEQPFRRKDGAFPRPRLFRLAAMAMATALALGLCVDLGKGFPQRLSPEAARIAKFENSKSPRHKKCFAHEKQWIAPENACHFGAKNTQPQTAVWGDSHANAMIEGIGTVAAKYGQSVLLLGYGGCPPITGLRRADEGPNHKCPEYTQAVMNYLKDTPYIKNVILLWRQSVYIKGYTTDFGPAESGENPLVVPTDAAMLPLDIRQQVYADHIQQTVQELLSAGKSVTLVYPIPETGYDIPSTLARMVTQGKNPAKFTRPFSYYQKRHAFVFDVLDNLAPNAQITRIYPHELLCDQTACQTWHDNAPLYNDDDHLSQPGAHYVATLFTPVFAPDGVRQ